MSALSLWLGDDASALTSRKRQATSGTNQEHGRWTTARFAHSSSSRSASPSRAAGGALLRRILTEHAPDDAKQQLAERVVKHLETSGFELDEDGQTRSGNGRRCSPTGCRAGSSAGGLRPEGASALL